MSKHDRSKQRYPAQVRHSVRPAPAPALDQPTDVLSFDDHEHTEIHNNLIHPQLAAPRPQPVHTAAPHEATFNAADERTEIQGNIDINAARALARARFGTDNANTFDEDERTEYQANPIHHAQPHQPRPTSSSPAVQPRTRFQTQGPRQAIAPVEQRHPSPNPHPVQQGHPAARHQPVTTHAEPARHHSSSHPAQHRPPSTYSPRRTSGMHPIAARQPAQPAYQPPPAQTLEERTEPAQEVHYHPPAQHVQSPQAIHAPAPAAQQAASPVAPTVERAPLSELPMGPVNLESKSSIFDVKSLQKVAFLKEETGVDFDLLSMSSPNLNALVLAMGAQDLAPELLDDHSGESRVTPLARKWGDPQSPPTRAMRLNYALWGGFAGLVLGLGLTLLLCAFSSLTLSSLGLVKYLLWIALTAIVAVPCALKPRRMESILLKLKPLPLNLPPSTSQHD